MNEPVEISKIIFNPIEKNYKVKFRTIGSNSFFEYVVSADNAKKISMSMEGISSSLLSPYDLFIELLDFLKIKVEKVLIYNHLNKVTAKILLSAKNKEKYQFILNITDSIIFSLKTFSTIFVDKRLLNASEPEVEKEVFYKEKFSHKQSLESKISKLEKAIEESIKSESYETAALLRDRINSLRKITS